MEKPRNPALGISARANAESHRLAAAEQRFRNDRSRSRRCSGAECAANFPGIMVPLPPRRGAHADNATGFGTAADYGELFVGAAEAVYQISGFRNEAVSCPLSAFRKSVYAHGAAAFETGALGIVRSIRDHG